MSEPRQRREPLQPTVPALFFVLFLLSGRWNLGRISEFSDLGLVGEPRVWFASALCLIAFVAVRRRPQPTSINVVWLLGFVVFFSYMMVTALYAPDPDSARDKGVELLLVLASSLALTRCARLWTTPELTEGIWKVLVAVLAVLAFLGLAADLGASQRLAVLGGGPNVFGRNMAVLCVAALAVLLRGGPRGLWGTIALVAGLLVVLSGSRGALVACVAGVIGVLYVTGARVGRLVPAIVFLVAAAWATLEYTDLGTKVMEVFHRRFIVLGLEERYDSGRSDIYLQAWRLGKEHLGVGAGLAAFPALTGVVYPHNIVLEALVEGGLIGVMLLMVVVLPVLFVGAIRRVEPRTFGAFCVFFAAAQFSGDFFDSRGVFLFGVLAMAQARGGWNGGAPARVDSRPIGQRIAEAWQRAR